MVNYTGYIDSQIYDQHHVELLSIAEGYQVLECQRGREEDDIDYRLFFFSCVAVLALLLVASTKETTFHQEIELR